MRFKVWLVLVAALAVSSGAGCTERALSPPAADPAVATAAAATPTSLPATSTPAPTTTATPTETSGLPPPPALLRLDPFYQKYVDAGGIPVVSSGKAPDEALLRVAAMVDDMLVQRPDLREAIIASGGRVAVRAPSETVKDLPEYRHYPFQILPYDVGASVAIPVSTVGTDNVLCGPRFYHRSHGDIFVHEFAHMVMNLDRGALDRPAGWWSGRFAVRVNDLFEYAMEEGLWTDTYAATNSHEYWAVAVQAWFDVGPHGNGVDTRAELEIYDPRVAALVGEVFGEVSVPSSCHLGAYPETAPAEADPSLRRFFLEGVVGGPAGERRSGVGVWLCQDGVRAFKYSEADGRFAFRVRPGSVTLAVYKGRTVLGWYGGENGFTTDGSEAAAIVVQDSDVTDIVIELPHTASGVAPVGEC